VNKNFKFVYRNPGHWDVYLENDNSSRRAAKIRGEPGNFYLDGFSAPFNNETIYFPSVESCMAYICATMIK
jgi:hypothetical protein